jgi:hypothetical protein
LDILGTALAFLCRNFVGNFVALFFQPNGNAHRGSLPGSLSAERFPSVETTGKELFEPNHRHAQQILKGKPF